MALLRRLHEKVARGEALDAQDRIDLILSPLMRQRRALDVVLPDAANMARSLPEDQLKPTIAALVGLAYHYVDEHVITEILEGIGMANLLQQYIEQGLEQGLQRGRAEGKRDAIRTILRFRFGPLSEAVEQRIATTDGDDLDVLVARASAADSLDDL